MEIRPSLSLPAALPQAAARPQSPDQVCLQSRDTVAAIERLLRGPTPRWSERKIIDLLKAADAGELNYTLENLNLRHLTRDVNNHCLGPQHYTELMQLLTRDRIGDLSVASKAGLVDALMRGRSRSEDERAMRDLFLSARGLELRAMKNLVDAGNDHYDLQNLMYHDLDDRQIRTELRDHFHSESRQIRAQDREMKVLSDIDDTFYSNLKDTRYPRGTVYPGVRQFYRELDGASPGDLTFLTARPEDPIGAIKDHTHRSLSRRGVAEKVVVAGSLQSLVSNEKIAAKKLENFTQYRHIFPEYDFCFTGDSGQGDVMLAEKMSGPEVRGRFIHDVVATPAARREEYRQAGIDFFDNYAGAALAAHSRGLLSLEATARVASATAAELAHTAFSDEAQRRARIAELQSDLDRLNALLPSEQRVEIPALEPLEQLPLPRPPKERNY